MITELKYIPKTNDSYPFQSAAVKCHFEQIGYIEDEYFMTGTANVYTETGSDHEVAIQIPDAPYTTRLLVRRPKDLTKFSGNVVIEILNATAMMDIDRIWVNTWKYLTRNGDIYIGITSKGHVVDALKNFDPDRYASINWANPDKTRKQPPNNRFAFLEEYESGLYWDMQTDLAKLLRTDSPKNPIREYGKSYLYLAGWSQSGSYIARTLHSFSYRPENTAHGPLFDGYFLAGLDNTLAPINAYENHETDGHIFSNGSVPVKGILASKEPLIALNTESESRWANWDNDCDEPDHKFRSYPIAGSSHDSSYSMIEYYEGHLYNDVLRARNGKKIGFRGIEGEPLDMPFEFIFQAALRNLYVWVREGVPAPHANPLEIYYDENCFDPMCGAMNKYHVKYENRKDAFGNSLGGIRMAGIEYPTGIYKSYCILDNKTYNPLFGAVYPLPKELLKELYQDCEHYRNLVEKNAERLISEGFLIKEDKTDYINQFVQMAKMRGLE